MDAIQHAINAPIAEVSIDGAARRQILGKITPLASRAQHVHDGVERLSHVCFPSAPSPPRRGDEGFDMRPLLIGQVARVSQMIPLVFRSVLVRPHRRPPIRSAFLESQPIHGTQQLSGQTLRKQLADRCSDRSSRRRSCREASRRSPPNGILVCLAHTILKRSTADSVQGGPCNEMGPREAAKNGRNSLRSHFQSRRAEFEQTGSYGQTLRVRPATAFLTSGVTDPYGIIIASTATSPDRAVSSAVGCIGLSAIEAWNLRMRGAISLRKREPLNTP